MGLFDRFRKRSSGIECDDVISGEFKMESEADLAGQESVESQKTTEVQESVKIPEETKRTADGKLVFKYHPNLYEDDILIQGEGVCQCCGRAVHEYIENVYSPEDVDCICLECVHSGEAAEKFKATFVEDAEPVSDSAKRTELFCRTPGYMAWQGSTGSRVVMIIVSIWEELE